MAEVRKVTMNWDELGEEDDDDRFFETFDRISSAVPIDLASSGSDDDDEDFDDSRMSFASAISSAPSENFRRSLAAVAASASMPEDYNVWMAEPGSIKERRRRLLQGMGLSCDKEFLRLTSAEFTRTVSTKVGNCKVSSLVLASSPKKESKQEPSPPSFTPIMLVRSRSDGDIESFYGDAERKRQLIGEVSKQRLTRTFSTSSPCSRMCRLKANSIRMSQKDGGGKSSMRKGHGLSSLFSNKQFGAFFLIKNLDTGKEFIVNEFDQHGMWNRLSDLQTGKQLTMEEFEKCVGYSPVVKELMRRENVSRNPDDGCSERKVTANSYLTKSFRYSKRRGVALLKNIKGVANSMSGLIADKDREHASATAVEQKPSKNNSSTWTKVRQHGKSLKELTALHLCQEIQAHQGSIWTIRFSTDARYLASAGEDRIIHVWEVQECEVMSLKLSDEVNSTHSSPLHPMACSSPDRSGLAESLLIPPHKKKKGKVSSASRKGSSIPYYVYMPETIFSLSEKPACSFKGHLDDVLDLSWSKSQLLLSSSMDKTVRLWDMETKSCLKLFAHNDYVTCIQFNPVDDRYFISGSLDAKVRIWSIPDRQVVDWTDLHEMVTAACYTPDGQGALIGSHKGNCRSYRTADCKLSQIGQFDIQNKKKSQAKKITGFQFSPENPSEVLITSADSRIRIYDGSDLVHKFRGFRNTSSQISASFSPNGKYVICASEDSQVFVWRREELKNVSTGKGKGSVNTRSHEHFQCRDVSVAIPWPGSVKGEQPTMLVQSKRYTKRPIQQPPSSNGSPTLEDSSLSTQSKRQLPPLPKKNTMSEKSSTCQEEELSQTSSVDPGIGIGESFSSASGSSRYGYSPSISASSNSPSASWSSSWYLFDGSNIHGSHTAQATAWGMVIVTAGLGGEIKAYQNFGLPVRIGRQPHILRDLA
ncbi:uncharacterized protein LOC131160097 [Malania oleifera]|uniref:uncharacterized protein LOC131160097 n=1 Tax=Malania oleifera TaxID=397392 RepID=UPI0025AE975F|nr:uncharacterized protein LOC131160097 [Malania oleifera]